MSWHIFRFDFVEIPIKMVNLCENMFEKKSPKMIPSKSSFDWISHSYLGRIVKTPMNCSFISIVWLFSLLLFVIGERSISCKEFIISIYFNTIADSKFVQNKMHQDQCVTNQQECMNIQTKQQQKVLYIYSRSAHWQFQFNGIE